jgi:kynurenine formamidase
MKEIFIEDIKKYKPQKKSHSDYSYGGWYLILNTLSKKEYVGKSIEYMFRLKQHINCSTPKTLIDKDIKLIGVDFFKFYLIKEYSEYDVNFFNRKIEGKIEQMLIKERNSNHPIGYNVKFYEQL